MYEWMANTPENRRNLSNAMNFPLIARMNVQVECRFRIGFDCIIGV